MYTLLFPCADKLLDADKLFSTVKKPSFLDSKSSHTDVDWDSIVKSRKMAVDSELCKNTHTVPPPISYEPQSASLKPTLGDPQGAVLNERKRRVKDSDADSDG